MTPRTAKTFLSLALVLLAVTTFAQEEPYIIGPGDVLAVTIFAGGKTQEAQGNGTDSTPGRHGNELGKLHRRR